MPVLLPTSRTRGHSKGAGAHHAQDHVRDRAKDHAVVIAGGGPTGLMLAAELALAHVDVAIVERRPHQELAGTRAGGLHSRQNELLDPRGFGGLSLAQGKPPRAVGFALIQLDISDSPTRHNYLLA